MARERILVVEDEEDILEMVTYNLVKAGAIVSCTSSGKEAVKMVKDDPPDLVLLDLMLPGEDGLDVCRALKKDPNTKNISIIMLTAKSDEGDILKGLELGADDYITKPFSPKVLIARIKAVLRRSGGEEDGPNNEIITVNDMVIHSGKYEVALSGHKVDLTNMEFKILHFLAMHPGWVYSRAQIVGAVRGQGYAVTDRSVDVTIVGLRKKLGDHSSYIETVRGVGYRFRGEM